MAEDFRTFDALIPAGTPIAAPVTVSLAFPPREVEAVEFRIPPGPSGNVGFALKFAGQQIIPSVVPSWIIGDGEVLIWPLDGYGNSGAWALVGYNTGTFPHTIGVRFRLLLPRAPGQALALPHPSELLSGTLR